MLFSRMYHGFFILYSFQVITTFALTFDIVPLIEEINCWFKFNLKTETFGRTLKTIHMLGKLGFSEESLTNKIKGAQIVLDLVNNSSKESFKHLLMAIVTEEEEQLFVGELDEIILNALCKSENNHLDVLLDVLVNKIDSNEKCKIVLGLFETIRKSDEADILCVFWSEVNEVIDKIVTLIDSSDTEILLFKSAHACRKSIMDLSKTECASPKKIRLELLRRTRCWRKYSVDNIKLLDKNNNLKCWHFAEIVLDWIDVQGPDFSADFETIGELRKMANNSIMNYLEDNPNTLGLCNYSIEVIKAFDRKDPPGRIFLRRVKQYLFKVNVLKSPSHLACCILIIFAFIVGICGISVYIVLYPSYFVYTVFGNVLNLIDNTLIDQEDYAVFITLTAIPFILVGIFKVFHYHYPTLVFSNLFSLTNVRISLDKQNMLKLTNASDVVSINPYLRYILWFLPFLRAELQLLNLNGMVEFDLRNSHRETNYNISHWYIKSNEYDSRLFSTFTATHSELLKFFDKNSEIPAGSNICCFCFCCCCCCFRKIQLQVRTIT